MNQSANLSSDSHVKILVVDDHPNTAKTLARAISQLGSHVNVVSATSGNEALECVKDGAADILITDMIMPEMTGLELIEKLNNHASGRPTFSFLMTAYEVPGLKVTAQRLKVREVILKPILPDRVCQIISRAIDEMNQVKTTNAEPVLHKSFNILIADDQPDNLTLLARYLENEGYGYIKAKDGLEALEKVRSEMPDLLLLDVNMPNKDGFEVLEEIRSDPTTQHIPVIILTAARLDPTDIQFGLNMGADDYVTKPFDRRELIARIRTKLRVKEAEDAMRRRNRELNLLPEIGRELSARLNIEEVSTVLLKHTVETLGAMFGHIIILNSSDIYQKTYQLSSLPQSPQAVSQPELLEFARETRQGFIIKDTCNDPRWQMSKDDPVRSAIIMPLHGRRNFLGLLMLANEQIDYFTTDHLLLLQAIASQASIAVEHAQLYDAISQEQQRLAVVLQGAAEAILVFDAKNCLSLINSAGQTLFSGHEIKIGQPLLSVGSEYECLQNMLDQARYSGASASGEIKWPDKRVFSTLVTPVQEGGIVAVLHDVTHFKELERVKDEFIAIASHDLKNPITSVKGFSQLIRQAGPLNQNQTEFVERIQYAAEHMIELVENMLDLAKIDLGAELKYEIFDIAQLLLQLTNEFSLQAGAKRQSLKLERADENLNVMGDKLKIRQALRNLIGNAIKYTPEGGVISLSLEHEDSRLKICVKDTGFGIPPADLPYIFDRFYRVRNNGHEDIDGNGLGLAIVKSIAEQHGGTVTVESEVNKGSCFKFTIPLLSNRVQGIEVSQV